jgi:integrase
VYLQHLHLVLKSYCTFTALSAYFPKIGERMRLQKGSTYEAANKFYVRYRVTKEDGTRTQQSEFLCDRDAAHPSENHPAVRLLRDQVMLRVNSAKGPVQGMTVADFWEHVYLPWAEAVKPNVGEANLRPSTRKGYRLIWNRILKDHFADTKLSEYRTAQATNLLTELSYKIGRNSVHHVRSLMSGIFSRAVARGYLADNPITGAGVEGKTATPPKTGHYSLPEALQILAALQGNTQAQLVMSLSFFWGLRPGEIRGLKWEDFSSENSEGCAICKEEDWSIAVPHVHIRRSIDPDGKEGKPKTDEAEAPLPLMVPIALPLSVWHEECGNPALGWVFEGRSGKASPLRKLVEQTIRPAVKAAGLKWRTLYAGRRGAATLLLQLTGNALASQQLLRHAPGSPVTAKHYLKALPETLLEGTRLVEEKVNALLAQNGEQS